MFKLMFNMTTLLLELFRPETLEVLFDFSLPPPHPAPRAGLTTELVDSCLQNVSRIERPPSPLLLPGPRPPPSLLPASSFRSASSQAQQDPLEMAWSVIPSVQNPSLGFLASRKPFFSLAGESRHICLWPWPRFVFPAAVASFLLEQREDSSCFGADGPYSSVIHVLPRCSCGHCSFPLAFIVKPQGPSQPVDLKFSTVSYPITRLYLCIHFFQEHHYLTHCT